jgi:hypothetical protein
MCKIRQIETGVDQYLPPWSVRPVILLKLHQARS